jgi:hypothetical protein
MIPAITALAARFSPIGTIHIYVHDLELALPMHPQVMNSTVYRLPKTMETTLTMPFTIANVWRIAETDGQVWVAWSAEVIVHDHGR